VAAACGTAPMPTSGPANVAALAPAETKVRAGAVFPGSCGPEHQAAGAVPQPTDNTYYGSCLLTEVTEKTRRAALIAQPYIPITVFFNTHAG
jgi:hypothetical protein